MNDDDIIQGYIELLAQRLNGFSTVVHIGLRISDDH